MTQSKFKVWLHRRIFDFLVNVAAKLADDAEDNIQWTPALSYWQLIANRRTNDPNPRARVLSLLLKLNRGEEALWLARSWTEQFRKSPALFSAAIAVAEKEKALKSAATWSLRYLFLCPGEFDARLRAARLCVLVTWNRKAEELLKELEAEQPSNPTVLEWRVRLAIALGEYDALRRYRTHLSSDPHYRMMRSLAGGIPRMEDRSRALELALYLIQVPCDDFDLLTSIVVGAERGNPGRQVLEFVKHMPPALLENHTILKIIGRARLSSEQREQGLLDLEKAHAMAPEDDTIVRTLALEHHKRLRWSMALPYWEALVSRKPMDLEPRIRVVDALIETGRYQEALACVDTAISVQGERPELREWRARISFAQGQWEESMEQWRVLAEVYPKRRAPAYYFGMSAIRAGKITAGDALAHFTTAVEQHPRDAQLLEKHAQIAERVDDYDSALGSWRRLIKLQPANKSAESGIARQLFLMGRFDELRDYTRELASKNKQSAFPDAINALATMTSDKDNQDQTRELIEKAIDRARDRFWSFMDKSAKSGFRHMATLDQQAESSSEEYRNSMRRFHEFVERATSNASAIIVGNSAGLLGQGLGDRIDSHDLVVRLNDFVTGEFTQDTGKRTDQWVTALGVQHRKVDHDISNIQALVCYMRGLEFGETNAVLNRVMGVNGEKVSFMPNFVMELLNDISYYYPSTGLRTILFYKLMNLDVSICGFDFFKEKVEHYYDCDQDIVWASESHSILYEYKFVYDLLVPQGLLNRIVADPKSASEPLPFSGLSDLPSTT